MERRRNEKLKEMKDLRKTVKGRSKMRERKEKGRVKEECREEGMRNRRK